MLLDIIRIAIHLLAGLGTGILLAVVPVVGAALTLGFLVYEVIEDWRINDHSYKDVFGFLLGLGLSGCLCIAVKVRSKIGGKKKWLTFLRMWR